MLPLWIIDITQKSDRCAILKQIIGQIDRVLLSEDADAFLNPQKEDSLCPDSNSEPDYEILLSQDPALNGKSKSMRVWEQFGVMSSSDEKDKEQEENEKKNRLGYLWYYSHFDSSKYNIDEKDYNLSAEDCEPKVKVKMSNEHAEDNEVLISTSAKRLAPKIYEFQKDLVNEGQRFMQVLLRSASSKYPAINICVIGDISERFTTLLYSSIAVMIQKEKGRIMPNHIHQGLSILGMLYLSTDTNSKDVKTRQRALYTLKEIEVQHRLPTVRGYDRILIYQDVQNKIERFYSLLDMKGQVQYLAQCLIHLYYACNHLHPLISGSASEDDLFFSMGVVSASFDTTKQDEYDRRYVANELIKHFLEEGEHHQSDTEDLINEEFISASNLINQFSSRTIDLSKAQVRHPNPDPYKDLINKELKRLYYNQYLRDFPANLMYKLVAVTEESLSSTLQEVSAQGKRLFDDFASITLPTGIDKIVKTSNENTGCLTRVEEQLARFKKILQQRKDEVPHKMETSFWNSVMERIPKYMQTHFKRYNEAYQADTSSKGISHEQDRIKKEAIDDLVNHLRVQSTVVSRICKTLLLCVISMIAIYPILDMISPWLIDLGHVRKHAVLWDLLICAIPIIWQSISLFRYERKTNRLISTLRSCFLHDAYARLANRIISEINHFYDKAGKLCIKYEERCNVIRKDIEIYSLDDLPVHPILPETQFCQPLIGGKFSGEHLIPKGELESSEISVNHARMFVSDLNKGNYFTLLQTMHELFRQLFKQVYLIPDHRRRFDKEKNAYVFVSREEEICWEERRWKFINKNFHKALLPLVKQQFCERRNSTIAEKMLKAKNSKSIFETLIKYSAANGDMTSTADKEYSDVKIGVVPTESIIPLIEDRMPNTGTTNYQVISQKDDTDGELYKSYMFMTRWRTFNSISYNRIFPLEDFDPEYAEFVINKEERKNNRYEPSSLILWAMSRDEKSSEWLNLFSSDMFVQAVTDSRYYKMILNKKD